MTVDDRWVPGIGDPTAVGWITVAAYILAAMACAAAARRRGVGAESAPPRHVLFWGALALLMLLLGINKELDVQSLFTQVMRDAARAQGWYAYRRELQLTFIFAVAAAGAAMIAALPRLFPRRDRAQNLALVGTILLFIYVLIRAASFHHVDLVLGQFLLSAKLSWVLEIGGAALVFLAAARSATNAAPPLARNS